ncbi:MAG TPA: alpha/beta fold hydrolase [Actinomycetota bacterium]
MAEVRILEGAEEFRLGEGSVGALLVHGFTGSPQGMRELGEYLAERGIAVVGPRLPGHGTTWQDLNSRTGKEWAEAVELGFHEIAAEREEVFVVALSFGAALAFDLAARYPSEVSGIVTLAGFLFSKDPRRFASPVIKRLVRSIPGVGNDIADPEGREIAYDRIPTSATHEMLRCLRRARVGLPSIACPVLVIHSRNDHTVHPSNAQYIYDTVASEDKELVWLERSYHVVTLDYEREDVFERTYRFIKERARGL